MSSANTNNNSTAANQQNTDTNLANNGPTTGSPNRTKVVTVKGNSLPPNNNSGQGQGQGQQPAAALNKAVVQPPASTDQQNNPDDIDIDKFISESTAEIKTGQERETERAKKTKYLTKALESRNNYERIIFSNSETGELIGKKIAYTKDDDGKSVYDYMNDPIVQEHIEFLVPEDDPQDGSPVLGPVSFYWKKPTF
jgi:hypothetical protein